MGVESNNRNEEEWQGKRQRTKSRTMTGRSRMTMDDGDHDPPHVDDNVDGHGKGQRGERTTKNGGRPLSSVVIGEKGGPMAAVKDKT